ncbi:MAG: radical SAM family heme chaperone HemW [Actinobacteria bacterium]|nr:radical SAM family heme chaperone HemW [Actinomycetota bacterium]
MTRPPWGERSEGPHVAEEAFHKAERGPAGRPPGERFGVYVHIPFCSKRCDYCAFATWTDRHHLHAEYIAACRAELTAADLVPATSVFVGGGTPSLIEPLLLTGLLADVRRAPGAEVTVECNPDNVSLALMRTYRDAGVNRISLGVQSTVPHVLESLGREHDRAAVASAAEAIEAAGFASFNADVIYGAAGESLADWETTLRDVLALAPSPPHISAYGLTVEAGTPLAAQPARHPDDDDQASKYLLAHQMLTDAGLANYEISNWARPGHECRHNALYWDQGNYRGIGCAAHSHADGRRWWNHHTPNRYVDAVGSGATTESGNECLDAETREVEALQLCLRTRHGVPAGALDESDPDLAGLVERQGERLVLTVAGKLLANEVALRLRTSAPTT